MTWTIIRKDTNPDGTEHETVVDCTDDESMIGVIMDTDRDKIDWEAEYRAISC